MSKEFQERRQNRFPRQMALRPFPPRSQAAGSLLNGKLLPNTVVLLLNQGVVYLPGPNPELPRRK